MLVKIYLLSSGYFQNGKSIKLYGGLKT